MSGSRLKRLRASFEKHQNLFSIYELSGSLHGGELTAQVRMGLDDPISYGVVAQAKSLDLNDVLRRVLKTRGGELEGLLSGRVLLQGQGTDPANLVGKAELTVHNGTLWEIPFVFRLLKMLNLSLPERTAFTDASANFDFYDRSVHVSRLNLIGNAISIYGKGVVKSNREVAFSFETGWGRMRLPELPFISLVVKGLQKQIISVKMTGTLSDPKLEILPIVPLTAPVKGLVDAILASQKQAKERK